MTALLLLIFLLIWGSAGLFNLLTGRTAQRQAAQRQRQAEYNAWFASLTPDQQLLEHQRIAQQQQLQALADIRYLTALNGLAESIGRREDNSAQRR